MNGELPPMQIAVLDAETVDQLFFDIEAAAELVEVVLKGAPEEHASAGPLTLSAARDALAARRVLGVQLRYRHAGKEWWDTLMLVPEGVRLVRIEHGAALAAIDGS